MTAIIWLFFLLAILLVLYWYKQHRAVTGAFDSTTGWFAMRDEKDPEIK
ncbi:MAG: hypothetical protein ACSLFB_01390 [Acidimicrobiales bacterium]